MKKVLSIVALSLILIMGVSLVGCNDSSGPLLLYLNAEKIEMLVTDEVQDYVITVQNHSKEVSFDFGFDNNYAHIVDDSLEILGEGKYKFSIAPLSSGSTVLNITLRGTNHVLKVPVEISEPLQKIETANNIFVERGKSLLLTNSLFNFTPQGTNLKNLTFKVKEGQELGADISFSETTNTLTVGQDAVLNEIVFVATSAYNSDITCEFTVKIVSPVDLSSLNVFAISQKTDNKEEYDTVNGRTLVYGYNGGAELTHQSIELITNQDTKFSKLISVEYNFGAEYVIDAWASDGIIGDISQGSPIKNNITNFNFAISANEVSPKGEPYSVTLKIYRQEFPDNFKTVSIDIYAVTIPKEIRVNSKKDLDVINLYHNNQTANDFRFSVFPSVEGNQNEENYTYSLKVYKSNDGLACDELFAVSQLNQILTINYGSLPFGNLVNGEVGKAEIKGLANLNSLLSIRPKTSYTAFIIISAECWDITDASAPVCTNQIVIKVHKGTTKFTFTEQYKDGTIYVAMPTGKNLDNILGTQDFMGFDYDADSTIGDLIITAKDITNVVCDIEELKGQEKVTISITPNKVGTSEFIIQTQNGLYVTLKVIVFREISYTNFSLEIDDKDQNAISDFSYQQTTPNYSHETLGSVTIKGVGQNLYVKNIIHNYLDVNEYSYDYSLSLDTASNPNAQDYFEIVDNTHIVSKNYTNGTYVTVNVTLNVYKMEAFKRVINEETKELEFNFKLYCIDYIKKLNITVSDGNEESQKTKAMSVYDKKTLGYTNQNLANAYVYLNLETCSGAYTHLNNSNLYECEDCGYKQQEYMEICPVEACKSNNIKNLCPKWTISVANISADGKVGSIGYFYQTKYALGLPTGGEDYIGKFVCDITGINNTTSFTITLKVTDQTGTSFESYVTIKIDKYIDVDSVYLTTPTDYIYLDNTDTYKTKTVGVYVLPADAMCKDIQIIIDSTTPSCITYSLNDGNITFTFVSGGEGKIRIFPVSKMKTSDAKDEYGNYYYHIALDFTCADGTDPSRALKLSNYEDLVNINPTLHYFIDSVINCGAKELYIPNFTGSIRGTFAQIPDESLLNKGDTEEEKANNLKKYQEMVEDYEKSYQSGGIINFKVKNNGANSGLFGIMAGTLHNLTIEGYFDEFKISENANIGVLAGTNNGTINNVYVSVIDKDEDLKITNTVEKDLNVYVGLIAGNNSGTIQVTDFAKNSTLMVNLQSTFKAQFNSHSVLDAGGETIVYKLTSYTGGLVGNNTSSGTIQNATSGNSISFGLYGTHANVNLSTNSSYLGGIVANNSGIIKGIKAVGVIDNTVLSGNTYTGGLVGVYSLSDAVIDNNILRILVRSNSSLAGLIGGFADTVTDFSKITNNKLQATDVGKTGIEASMIVKRGGGEGYVLSPNDNVSDPSKKLPSTNIAETYVNRDIYTSYLENLPVGYYYGDLIVIPSGGKGISEYKQFTKGTEESLEAKNSDLVLAIYKQAKDASLQEYVNNNVLTETIVKKIAEISGNEFNIDVSNISVLSVANFGKNLTVNNTGYVEITLTSSLNYLNKTVITVYITNYFEEVKTYLDKDYIKQSGELNVINSQSDNVYVNCFSAVYIYKNTPIEIATNKEVTFDVVEVQDDGGIDVEVAEANKKLNTSVVGQTVYVQAKQQEESVANVNIYPIIKINGNVYYAVYSNDLQAYTFVSGAKDFNVPLNVTVNTGIENIEINKSKVVAEPSNEVEIEVVYNSYNTEDYFAPEIIIDQNKYYVIWDADKKVGMFEDNAGNEIFKITLKSHDNLGENKFKDIYVFNMVVNQNNYLNYKNSNVTLIFKSVKTEQYNSINLEYTPETITAVLVDNYSYEENDGMIDERKYNLGYYEQNMLNSSIYSSTGEYNILKTYVYTRLGEFDYVEISLNAGINGGYLALGKTTLVEVDGEMIEKGVANKNIIYTSIDGVVTLKAYKSDIISNAELFNGEERMLEMTIIYSLPVGIADGTKVPITLTFFKNTQQGAQVCYPSQDVYVVAKMASRVEFTIYDKESMPVNEKEIDLKASQAYAVVKGKTYALVTDIYGYSEDEVVFESSNPNIASIECMDGQYYLNITRANINYNDEEYYTIVISSYGEKVQNNKRVKGKVQTTVLRVYEFLIDETQGGIFDDNTVSLKVLTTVDIREEIVGLLKLEYANSSASTETFKTSFMEKSKWELISNGITINLPTSKQISSTQYKLNGYELQPLKTASVAPYQITVEYYYTYKNGVPTCDLTNANRIIGSKLTFNVEVYLSTTGEIPAPIETYQDLQNMNDDEHYILVNDITVPGNDFEMITSTPKSLDGNGYKIIITGENFGSNLLNVDSFALFETISQGAVFKNITIYLKNSKNILINNNYHTSGVNVGILTATNYGIITNCSIIGENTLNVNVASTVTNMENSYFGSICAVNYGYITNSRTVADIKFSGMSFGGIVANNEGQIASTYIKNSRLVNEFGSSNQNIIMGGFVGTNTGKISMCYIEGATTNKIYASYETNKEQSSSSKIINTSSEVGGFAYKNDGEIYDCYANIPIVSTNRCAGFVAQNNGTIKRAISLSKMKQKDTQNYAFVISYSQENAVFENCYFVIEKDIINDFTSETNYQRLTSGGVTVGYAGVINGVTPLGIKDFNILNSNGTVKENNPFAEFIVGNNAGDISGVWFYTFDATKDSNLVSPLQTYKNEVTDFNYYDVDKKEYVAQEFTAGVIQLTAPNLIATSRQILNMVGETEYNYSVDDKLVAQGTKENPYLISSAQHLEQFANQKSASKLEYFRLICDVNYEQDGIYNTSLSSKKLFAYIEGNGFEISNYVINTKTSLVSAGLFSQIGKENSELSTLKNITFKPSYINLPNSIYVGGIAGTVTQAKVYNVSIDGDDVVVSGKNIVGGLFGRTTGETYLKGLNSNVVAKSSYYDAQALGNTNIADSTTRNNLFAKITYKETSATRARASYAGGLIGHLGGSSIASNLTIGQKARAFGVFAGLVFGGVGIYSEAHNIYLNLNSYNNEIKAYGFGGIVTGENSGKLNNIKINSNILNKTLFGVYPVLPMAVGGVAGLMNNGSITNLSSTSGYSVIGADFTGNYAQNIDGYAVAQINNPYVVQNVGGVVGVLTNGTINNINVFGLTQNAQNKGNYNVQDGVISVNETQTGAYDKDSSVGLIVCGSNNVGGVVGSMFGKCTINNIYINIVGHKKYTNQDENVIDELIYSSYVNETSSYLISDFSLEANFGTLIGKNDTSGFVLPTNKLIETNKGEKIYTYFACYSTEYKPTNMQEKVYKIGSNSSGETVDANRTYICISNGEPINESTE